LHVRKFSRAVEHPIRRQADADAVAADGSNRPARDLERQTDAAVDAAAVPVGAQVDDRVEELLDEVAVGGVQLDTVEAGIEREPCRGHIGLDGNGDVGLAHCAGWAVRLHAQGVGVHLARTDRGTRPQHLGTGRQVGHMRHPAAMHQLHEDLAALGVYGRRRGLPRVHLLRVVQPGDAGIAQAIGAGRGAFGDDQTGRRTLPVVGGHQRIRCVPGRRATAGHRRHHDAVGQMQGSCVEGVEQHRGIPGVGRSRSRHV
jgi:hypothetical protein